MKVTEDTAQLESIGEIQTEKRLIKSKTKRAKSCKIIPILFTNEHGEKCIILFIFILTQLIPTTSTTNKQPLHHNSKAF